MDSLDLGDLNPHVRCTTEICTRQGTCTTGHAFARHDRACCCGDAHARAVAIGRRLMGHSGVGAVRNGASRNQVGGISPEFVNCRLRAEGGEASRSSSQHAAGNSACERTRAAGVCASADTVGVA
jgi:hypothetical protein